MALVRYVRAAYEAAMGKDRSRSALVIVPLDKTAIPYRIDWLRSEMLKTRAAHRYWSRDLVAEACPYPHICKQCENFLTTPEFGPTLENPARRRHRPPRRRQHPGLGTPRPPATNGSSTA